MQKTKFTKRLLCLALALCLAVPASLWSFAASPADAWQVVEPVTYTEDFEDAEIGENWTNDGGLISDGKMSVAGHLGFSFKEKIGADKDYVFETTIWAMNGTGLDVPWNTCFLGMRYQETTDYAWGDFATGGNGVWLAFRNNYIGMRETQWSGTGYLPALPDGMTFNGRRVRVEDNKGSNVIKVYVQKDDGSWFYAAYVKMEENVVTLVSAQNENATVERTLPQPVLKDGYVRWHAHGGDEITKFDDASLTISPNDPVTGITVNGAKITGFTGTGSQADPLTAAGGEMEQAEVAVSLNSEAVVRYQALAAGETFDESQAEESTTGSFSVNTAGKTAVAFTVFGASGSKKFYQIMLSAIEVPTEIIYTPVAATAFGEMTLHDPMGAFDNNPATKWQPHHDDHPACDAYPKWIQADLGEAKDVNSIRIAYEHYATEFEIWVGDNPEFDDDSHTVAYRAENAVGMQYDFMFPTARGRYVRFVAYEGYDDIDPGVTSQWWTPTISDMIISNSSQPAVFLDNKRVEFDGSNQYTYQIAKGQESISIRLNLIKEGIPQYSTDGTNFAPVAGAAGTAFSVALPVPANLDNVLQVWLKDVFAQDVIINIKPTIDPPGAPYGVVGATASSASPNGEPIVAFDGKLAGQLWQPWGDDPYPRWIQADLGKALPVNQVTIHYVEHVATEFEIWVGNDPGFAEGSYEVACHETGKTELTETFTFPTKTGRYVHFEALDGKPDWFCPAIVEMEITYMPAGTTVSIGDTALSFTDNQADYNLAQGQNSLELSIETPEMKLVSYSFDNSSYTPINSLANWKISTNIALSGGETALYLKDETGTVFTINLISAGEPQQPEAQTYTVVDATAISHSGGPDDNLPQCAFDGNWDTLWQASETSTYPKWIQANLGEAKLINRAVIQYDPTGQHLATDYEIWVGDDPDFAQGSYMIVHEASGRDQDVENAVFATVRGQYLRFVAKNGNPAWWCPTIREMTIGFEPQNSLAIDGKEISLSGGAATADFAYGTKSLTVSVGLESARQISYSFDGQSYQSFGTAAFFQKNLNIPQGAQTLYLKNLAGGGEISQIALNIETSDSWPVAQTEHYTENFDDGDLDPNWTRGSETAIEGGVLQSRANQGFVFNQKIPKEKNYTFETTLEANPGTGTEGGRAWETAYLGLRQQGVTEFPTNGHGIWLAFKDNTFGTMGTDWPYTYYAASLPDGMVFDGRRIRVEDNKTKNQIKVWVQQDNGEWLFVAQVDVTDNSAVMSSPLNPGLTIAREKPMPKDGYVIFTSHGLNDPPYATFDDADIKIYPNDPASAIYVGGVEVTDFTGTGSQDDPLAANLDAVGSAANIEVVLNQTAAVRYAALAQGESFDESQAAETSNGAFEVLTEGKEAIAFCVFGKNGSKKFYRLNLPEGNTASVSIGGAPLAISGGKASYQLAMGQTALEFSIALNSARQVTYSFDGQSFENLGSAAQQVEESVTIPAGSQKITLRNVLEGDLEITLIPAELPQEEVFYDVVDATAINTVETRSPMNAFDGDDGYGYWQTNYQCTSYGSDGKWLQADLGEEKDVNYVEINYIVNYATEIEIWVGNDPSFAEGSYAVALHDTTAVGSLPTTGTGDKTIHHYKASFPTAKGRYVRYVARAGYDDPAPGMANWYTPAIEYMRIGKKSVTEITLDGMPVAITGGIGSYELGYNQTSLRVGVSLTESKLITYSFDDGPYAALNDVPQDNIIKTVTIAPGAKVLHLKNVYGEGDVVSITLIPMDEELWPEVEVAEFVESFDGPTVGEKWIKDNKAVIAGGKLESHANEGFAFADRIADTTDYVFETTITSNIGDGVAGGSAWSTAYLGLRLSASSTVPWEGKDMFLSFKDNYIGMVTGEGGWNITGYLSPLPDSLAFENRRIRIEDSKADNMIKIYVYQDDGSKYYAAYITFDENQSPTLHSTADSSQVTLARRIGKGGYIHWVTHAYDSDECGHYIATFDDAYLQMAPPNPVTSISVQGTAVTDMAGSGTREEPFTQTIDIYARYDTIPVEIGRSETVAVFYQQYGEGESYDREKADRQDNGTIELPFTQSGYLGLEVLGKSGRLMQYRFKINRVPDYDLLGFREVSAGGAKAEITETGLGGKNAALTFTIDRSALTGSMKLDFSFKAADGVSYTVKKGGAAITSGEAVALAGGDILTVYAQKDGVSYEPMPYEVVFNTVSDTPVFSKFVIKDFEKERTIIDSKEKTVTLKLPKGTKVGSAIPIFTVSAKAPEFVVTVDGKAQESGVSVQNLSSPKNYTITTSYGASVTYKVSVEFVDTDVVPDKGGPSSGSSSRNNFGTVDTGQAGPELVPIAEPERFTDITGQADWAKQAIYALADRGIINGVTESTFAPMEAVTREQFVKMILLALDLYEETSPQAAFDDVEAGAWYAPYIASAVSQGIIKGISETEFGVGQQVSRQDMAVILYRAMAKTGWVFADAGSQTAFSDDGDIAAYAKEAVASLSAAGIINGMTESTFAPGQAANRAQAAVILYRMLETMEQTNSGEGEA